MTQVAASLGSGRIIRRKNYARYLVTATALAVLLSLLYSIATNPRIEWATISEYWASDAILSGLRLTLELTVVSMFLGSCLGAVLAVMLTGNSFALKTIANGFIWIFRGTPLLVQLLIWFNLALFYPSLSLGIPGVQLDTNEVISPLIAAILALTLHEAAYMCEIIRSGIMSITSGQGEAGFSLGMTRGQTMRRIVFPQAMRIIIPPTGNQVISMLKTTSLVSVIALSDLLYSSEVISAYNYKVIPLLLVATIWYLTVVSILSVGQHFIERRFGKGISAAL